MSRAARIITVYRDRLFAQLPPLWDQLEKLAIKPRCQCPQGFLADFQDGTPNCRRCGKPEQ